MGTVTTAVLYIIAIVALIGVFGIIEAVGHNRGLQYYKGNKKLAPALAWPVWALVFFMIGVICIVESTHTLIVRLRKNGWKIPQLRKGPTAAELKTSLTISEGKNAYYDTLLDSYRRHQAALNRALDVSQRELTSLKQVYSQVFDERGKLAIEVGGEKLAKYVVNNIAAFRPRSARGKLWAVKLDKWTEFATLDDAVTAHQTYVDTNADVEAYFLTDATANG